MNLYVGTSGLFTTWSGGASFIQRICLPRQMLHFYGECFRAAVEINSTFNGTPNASVMERWVEAVGGDFKFSQLKGTKADHPREKTQGARTIWCRTCSKPLEACQSIKDQCCSNCQPNS